MANSALRGMAEPGTDSWAGMRTIQVPCPCAATMTIDRGSSATVDGQAGTALLRSAAFRAATREALELGLALRFDGLTLTAALEPTADDRAARELARRLYLVAGVVEALSPARPPEPEAPRVEASGALVYEGALHELVAIGFYKPALEALCRGAAAGPTPTIDRDYLLKILSEEASRQFCHPLRPIVELVLNGVDALTEAGASVEVRVGEGWVEVRDEGVGMDLAMIVSRLLLPFATDKKPGEDIGRFGVGFFSVLGMGLAHPESFRLEVRTSDGGQGYALAVTAPSADVSSLWCVARRVDLGRGTIVSVRSALIDATTVRAYLRDMLHFIPAERASVRVDGVPINDGSLVRGGRTLEEVVMAEPSRVTARFHMGGRGLAPSIVSASYHAGVKVESCLAIGELVLVDFPGAVELTEARDAIKLGPVVDAVALAFHRRVAAMVGRAPTARATRHRLAELAGQVSSLLFQSAGWAEAAPMLADALLGRERYLVAPERVQSLLGFLGADVAERIFVPESFWAEREWHHQLPGEKDLLMAALTVTEAGTLAEVAERRPDLPGLALIARRSPASLTVRVALVRAHDGSVAALPCLGTRDAVLFREDAPALRARAGWADSYVLRAAFDRSLGARESDVEREIIVGDPSRAGVCR